MSDDTTTAPGVVDQGTQELWDALSRARVEPAPCTLSRVEDALFRHYLPIALAMAAAHAPDDPDPEGVRLVAETGMAQAILSWRQGDSGRFDRYARATITDRLCRHDRFTATQQRRSSSPSLPPPGTAPARSNARP
jgi:hypothetical protein